LINLRANEKTEFHIKSLAHVNVTVPSAQEAAAREFYGRTLGLTQVRKPAGPRQNVGAWYELGDVQLHLSVSDKAVESQSDSHVCYLVEDLSAAESHLRAAGIEIIADPRPMAGAKRFYIRDPGGNLIELSASTA